MAEGMFSYILFPFHLSKENRPQLGIRIADFGIFEFSLHSAIFVALSRPSFFAI